jgi:hypothetical protein
VSNWLKRARADFANTGGQGTDNTDVTEVSTVMTVPQPRVFEEIAAETEKLDPAVEARRERIVAIFDSNPRSTRAVVTDTQSEPGAVIVTIGLRGDAIGEIVIPACRYDGLALLALIERYATDPQPAIH